MTLISYAQNFEDVLLWRALGRVDEGFYIDVGAQHPRIDSVSLLFHEQGWRGIHVEPSTDYAALLRAQRPGDEVIEAALSAHRGRTVFHEIKGTGLSTLTQEAMAAASTRGFEVIDRAVRTMLLDDVLGGIDRPIHWLKIDVEGHERFVIDGWSCPVRPWVLLIESTLPGSQVEAYQDWEPDILAKGYHFVWFDGLNRFYVHDGHADLDVCFRAPPNVFDGFALSGEATSAFANLLNARAAELDAQASERENAWGEQARVAADRLAHAERLAAEDAATIAGQAHGLVDAAAGAAADNAALAQRVADGERTRAQLDAALETLAAGHAAEIDRLQQERDRIAQDGDALRQQLSEGAIALEAAWLAGAATEREAAVAAAVADQAQARGRDDAARARGQHEAHVEAVRLEYRAALDVLKQVVERAAAENTLLRQQLRDAENTRDNSRAGEATALRDAAVAAALLVEIRSRMASIATDAVRQRRADRDVAIQLRGSHVAEKERMDAERAALEVLVMEQRTALATAQEAERAAKLQSADVGRRQSAMLAEAIAETQAGVEEAARHRTVLTGYHTRLIALLGGAAEVDRSDIDTVLDAVEATVSAYRARVAALDAARGAGAWTRAIRALDLMRRDGPDFREDLYAIARRSPSNVPDGQWVEHTTTGTNPVRSLRSFWSRDTVADRVDTAVAALAAQLQASLGEGFAGISEEVERVRERCDAIVQSTERIEVMGRAVSRLVSATDHLTDIGMANIHQTAIVQHMLEDIAPAARLAAGGTEGVDASTAMAAGIDAENVLQLAPAERQIFDNFTRALRAL